MQLNNACTHLVRFMEDNRDQFRTKERNESWTKFLLGDLYARHMINEIVKAAQDYVVDGALIKTFTQSIDRNEEQVDGHEFTIEPVDVSRRNARGVGSVVLRVRLHRKYTASVYLQF